MQCCAHAIEPVCPRHATSARNANATSARRKAKGTQGQPPGVLLCFEMATMPAYEAYCVIGVCIDAFAGCACSQKRITLWEAGSPSEGDM